MAAKDFETSDIDWDAEYIAQLYASQGDWSFDFLPDIETFPDDLDAAISLEMSQESAAMQHTAAAQPRGDTW